jgi:hypothetical protein
MVKIIRNTRYVVRKFNGDATIELFARSEAGPELHSEKGSEKGNAKAAKAGQYLCSGRIGYTQDCTYNL